MSDVDINMTDVDINMTDADCHMSTTDTNIAFSPDIIDELYSDNADQQLLAAQKTRRLLFSNEPHPPIDKVIQAGIVPKLVEFLQRDDNSNLQFEAAWVLTNIASGTSDQTKVVVEAGAVPIFIRLLDSESEDVQEHIIDVKYGNKM